MPTEQLSAIELTGLKQLEAIIEKGKQSFVDVGEALAKIRDARLYRKDFDTFEEYCQKRWEFSDRRGRQLIDSAIAAQSVATETGTMVPNERAAREVLRVLPANRAKVVKEAAKNGTVTAKSIEAAAAKFKPSKVIELDKTGFQIPEEILEAWNAADEEAVALLGMLSKIRSAVKFAQDNDVIHFREISHSELISRLNNDYYTISLIRPFAVCAACQGKLFSKCSACKRRGFISKFAWERQVPEEMKALRAKVSKAKK